MCFDCLSTALNEQHKVKARLAEEYDAPLHEISKYFTLNQCISGLQIQARTIKKQWAKMPSENKAKMLEQLAERLSFIVQMQREEKGSFGEIVPDRFAEYDLSDPVLFDEVLKHIQTDKVAPLRLSNSMKLNPHG